MAGIWLLSQDTQDDNKLEITNPLLLPGSIVQSGSGGCRFLEEDGFNVY